MKKIEKPELDALINKFISRKLIVFIIACIGLLLDKLTSSDWVIIATAYITVQGMMDTFSK